MRRILLLLFLAINFSFAHAGRVTGTIKDDKGNPLPYASVTVKGTTRGTTSNSAGVYTLNLDNGSYTLVCQYVGYSKVEKPVTISGKSATVDFILQVQEYTLGEVIVKKGEDPAYEIIRQAIKKRDYYNRQVDSFTVDVYIKGLLRSRGLPTRFMGQKIERDASDGLDSAGKGIVFLSESLTRVDYTRGNIKYNVISSRQSGGGYGLSFPFFINFYQNNVSVFGDNLNPRGFVSPISDGAMNYYRFRYQGSFIADGKMVNTIKVIPRRKNEPLFTGTIEITEDDWKIYSIDLLTTKQYQLEMLDTLRVTQLHGPVTDDVWKTNSQVLQFGFKMMGFNIAGNFVNVYNDYNIDPGFEKKHFGRTLMKYDTAFNKKDSNYWNAIRPVALEPDEKQDFIFKDSVSIARDSAWGLVRDSASRQRNKFSLKKILWTGQGAGIRGKGTHVAWSLKPLIRQMEYNTVEGLSINVEQSFAFYRKNMKRNVTLDVNSRYGFSNQHFNTYGVLNIAPRGAFYRNRYLRFAGGKRVSQFNQDNPIGPLANAVYTLTARRNYMKLYENWFGMAEYNNRLENGFSMNFSLRYEDRLPLNNTTDFSFFKKDREMMPNHPYELAGIPFNRNQAVIAAVTLSFQPGQRYIEYPNQKMSIGSDAPTFELNYEKGIRSVLGSDADFDKWKFSVSDNINLKLRGEFKYRIGAGGFLNDKSVSIPDFRHFNGNETFYNTNYLNSFQLAPYYRYSNTEPFFLYGHAEHHFNGLLTNKIPLFNRLKWHLVGGANTFYVNKDNYYLELFAGIENIFKVIRVDFVTAYQQETGNNFGVRIGFGGLIGGKLRFSSGQ